MDDLEPGNMAVNRSPLCFVSSAFQVSGEQIHDNFPAGLGGTGVFPLPWSLMSCHGFLHEYLFSVKLVLELSSHNNEGTVKEKHHGFDSKFFSFCVPKTKG